MVHFTISGKMHLNKILQRATETERKWWCSRRGMPQVICLMLRMLTKVALFSYPSSSVYHTSIHAVQANIARLRANTYTKQLQSNARPYQFQFISFSFSFRIALVPNSFVYLFCFVRFDSLLCFVSSLQIMCHSSLSLSCMLNIAI